MKPFPIYQVDAFTDSLFKGNPAAVVIFDAYPDDRVMQNIALENNLAETAFLVFRQDHYAIRWFTPKVEVDLCGHATLASAYVIFHFLQPGLSSVRFLSARSGELQVQKLDGERLQMDFPADKAEVVEFPFFLYQALGTRGVLSLRGKDDALIILENEEQVRKVVPDFRALVNLKARGVIVSAKGDHCDFVSRFFAPQSGIDEDPVTGSAHTLLTPYWSEVMDKTTLSAQQISSRGGTLYCEDCGDRVKIMGKAKLFLKGEIYL